MRGWRNNRIVGSLVRDRRRDRGQVRREGGWGRAMGGICKSTSSLQIATSPNPQFVDVRENLEERYELCKTSRTTQSPRALTGRWSRYRLNGAAEASWRVISGSRPSSALRFQSVGRSRNEHRLRAAGRRPRGWPGSSIAIAFAARPIPTDRFPAPERVRAQCLR